MRAVRVHAFGAADVLRLEEVGVPAAGKGEVLVALRAAGVNPVDTYIRSGTHHVRPELPYTPGEDGAGVVAEVGEDVVTAAPGDRVYVAGSLTGTYAEWTVCRVDQVHPLPAHLSFPQGAALGVPYLTAHRGLFHAARARAGETVLVHGASGGVGLAAVQFARAAGLRVVGTGGTADGRSRVLAEGAHDVLDHHAPEMDRALLDLTGGRGVDVVLEMRADLNLERDLALLAPHGRIVLVGSRGRIEIDPRAAMVREAAILGVFHYATSAAERASAHQALDALLEAGCLRPSVACELPLAEVRAAHERVLQPGSRGKIVLTTDGGGALHATRTEAS